jgi:hypothetical protein
MASATWNNFQPGIQNGFAAGNWSDDAVPTAADNVTIDDNPADTGDSLDGPTIFESGAAASTVTLEAGALTIGYIGSPSAPGTLTVGTLTVDSAAAGDGVNAPELNVDDGTLTSGSVTDSGVITNNATMNVTGAVTMDGGGLAADAGTLTAGSISMQTAQDNVLVQGGALDVGSLTDSSGTVKVTASTFSTTSMDVSGTLTLTDNGTFTVGQASQTIAVSATVGSIVSGTMQGTGQVNQINVIGSATKQSALYVQSGAGFGTAGVLTGTVDLQGDALLQFASGQIDDIEGDLILDGSGAAITDYNQVTGVGALAQGFEIYPDSTLDIRDDTVSFEATTSQPIVVGSLGLLDVDTSASAFDNNIVGGSNVTLGPTSLNGIIKVGTVNPGAATGNNVPGTVALQKSTTLTTGPVTANFEAPTGIDVYGEPTATATVNVDGALSVDPLVTFTCNLQDDSVLNVSGDISTSRADDATIYCDEASGTTAVINAAGFVGPTTGGNGMGISLTGPGSLTVNAPVPASADVLAGVSYGGTMSFTQTFNGTIQFLAGTFSFAQNFSGDMQDFDNGDVVDFKFLPFKTSYEIFVYGLSQNMNGSFDGTVQLVDTSSGQDVVVESFEVTQGQIGGGFFRYA